MPVPQIPNKDHVIPFHFKVDRNIYQGERGWGMGRNNLYHCWALNDITLFSHIKDGAFGF
jgi:hypothetical protein